MSMPDGSHLPSAYHLKKGTVLEQESLFLMCCCLTCLRGQRSGDESASRPAPMSGRTTCDRHAIVEPCCHAASWSHCIATLNSPNSTPAAHNRRAHNMCVWGGVGVCWVCALDSPEVCLRSSRRLQHVPRLLQPAQPRCVVRTHIDSERPKTQKCTEAAVASCSRRLTTSKCVGGGGRLVAILQQHLVLSLEVGGRPHACPGRAVRPFRSRRPQQHAGGRRGQYALPQPERATEYSLRARALQAEYSLRCRRPIARQD